MKLLTSLATIILIGLFTSLMVAANSVSPERITVIINGETLEFANPPFVENAEILVPIRPIVDFFGVDLQWDSQARVATIVNGSITITIAADSYEILWQCSYTGREEIFEMPVPARIHNNALFMPAHDIVAVLDYTINYVEDFATSFRWGRVDGEAVSSYQSTLWLAESGFAHSQFRVAVMYAHGWEGAPRDFERAAYWYRKAAESGIPQAQNNLGMLYRHGNGVPQNYETAVYWYKKAVEQGEPNAEFNLGFAYLMGLGVEADPAQSAYWNRRAAEQGQDRAQAQMGF
ncbi:MAG: stalk domain-containing protein, partial [Defluviitaleaceae bacterium]|nr:stalk domain-containing protein [Defluviitaleaceae bacterium]